MSRKRNFTHDLTAAATGRHAHSTPDPESPPPDRTPTPPTPVVPDDEPLPSHAPVQEPTLPEPPIRAGQGKRL
jgi:hypothetical protein